MALDPSMTEISWLALTLLVAGSAVFGLIGAGALVFVLGRTDMAPGIVKIVAASEFVLTTGLVVTGVLFAFPELWQVPV